MYATIVIVGLALFLVLGACYKLNVNNRKNCY